MARTPRIVWKTKRDHYIVLCDGVPTAFVRTEEQPQGYLIPCAAGEEPTKFSNARGIWKYKNDCMRVLRTAIVNTKRALPTEKHKWSAKVIMDTPKEFPINVTQSEAFMVAGFLKVQARKLQEVSDSEGMGHQGAQLLKASSAGLDAFADKLYAPFIPREFIMNLDEQADKGPKFL